MPKQQEVSVAIVGGGPCGLFLALLLGRRGVRCHVFEKKPGLSTHPKAMGISRRTAEIFRQTGLLDALYEPNRHLTEGPETYLNIFARSFVGEEFGRIPLTESLSPLSPGPAFSCPQPHTEQTLFAVLVSIAPGCVRFDSEVTSVTPGTGSVAFTVGDQVWRSDWLVAADGAGGQIRHWLGVESDGPGDMGHFLNTYFRAGYGPHLSGRRSRLFTIVTDNLFESFVSVNGDDLWLLHHFLQPGETAADFPPEKLARMIQNASGLPEVPVEVLSVSPWVMSPKVSRKFRVGRVLLVGDAAARLSPAGGLGMNTGLQSVHNLAWKLAMVAKGQGSSRLLDTYEEERHGAASWTLEHTNRNTGELFSIVRAAISQDWNAVRTLVAQNGRAGSRLGIDLGIEYASGAFLPDGSTAVPRRDPVNDYVPNARPGARAPYLVLEDGRSTFDLLGQDFTVLAVEPRPEKPSPCASQVLPASSKFAAIYGLEPGGCVLIRPDGYIAARWKTSPRPGEVARVLKEICD